VVYWANIHIWAHLSDIFVVIVVDFPQYIQLVTHCNK